ncbi:hypothetical protein SAMN04487846_2220 [Microbacterium sp. cf046]|uniref:hypothetical protein n=1 Tax=Microbacterium sp. cf046 TaxID=1761803 RepID=UPI0008EE60CA|nr:hypothetical protein [Microbacterium sp. cf046]SFS07311.1 hypothetical protein SAMN04487846_2220 [Microbacterium sp. cf046]
MTRALTLFGASVVIAATLLVATGCTGAPGTPDGPETPTPVATSPQPTPEVTQSAEPAGDPTCETIIPASTVEDFESVGWTARAESFRIGATEIAGGVQCIWGDFSTATDHVQIYGWAPISAEDAADAQAQLVAMGWRKEDVSAGVIVTESADTTVATDADGYGLTYLFGDGWVKYADTKQGLLLVVWPSP